MKASIACSRVPQLRDWILDAWYWINKTSLAEFSVTDAPSGFPATVSVREKIQHPETSIQYLSAMATISAHPPLTFMSILCNFRVYPIPYPNSVNNPLQAPQKTQVE